MGGTLHYSGDEIENEDEEEEEVICIILHYSTMVAPYSQDLVRTRTHIYIHIHV